MSKSATDDLSRINLEDSADSIRDKISRAKTDSMDHISFDPENRPEISNLISIFSSITGNDPENISSSYQGNKLTKKFKEDLADALIEHIIPIQKELSRLKADPSYLSQILCEGNARASKIAQSTMQEVREAVGLCSPSPL